ncbi:MAG: hypothetical protein IKY40_01575 [Phascolarctobacterium sp.]|nr:hypothetical protein [Phascolarctobacterium sp.]MBR5589455.1 hypothetical protein [Phascolarctobacterium sp.]MBR5790416.1 hypothetical protein [Phascolarctobacterium sp.]
MQFIPLFFICLKMYSFMNYREIAYFLHQVEQILEHRRKNPGSKQVIYMDKTSLRFFFFLGVDIFFLLYCIYLMSDQATWHPGFFLITLSILEAVAMRARISGTYVVDKLGFVYGQLWFRYVMSASTLFILLKLFKND